MNAADFRALIMTGSDRHAEAIAEHTAHSFDLIFNGSSKRAAATAHKPQVQTLGNERSLPPCADARTAGVGVLYPVTCAAHFYDAASRILDDEGCLAGNPHDNCNELGALIEQWIAKKRDNWEPR